MSKKNPLAHAGEHHKACAALIREVAYRHRLHQVFSDFVEMAAIALTNAMERRGSERWQTREARYLEIAKTYTPEELAKHSQMLACVVEGLEAGPCDFLGELFMNLDLGSHWKGQFFTPYEVSGLMARMTLGDGAAADIDAKGGFITVNEPACGSGAMVMAFADAMRDQGLNPQSQMHVTAQDLDATAVHMAVIQLSLRHIPAIVIQGNSLAMEVRDYWLTPSHVLGRWDSKLARRAAAVPPSPAETSPLDLPPAAADVADSTALAPPALGQIRDEIAIARVRDAQLALF